MQVVGWCLGGIMSLLALAARPDLPVNSIAVVASPFDFARAAAVRADPRRGERHQRPASRRSLYRALGGAPAPLVKRALPALVARQVRHQAAGGRHRTSTTATSSPRSRPSTRFTDNMHAYPGRTMGQLYHRFFRVNDLADGRLELGDHDIDLADVQRPGARRRRQGRRARARSAAVHHVGELLTGAPEVRLKTGPGGHLGVLTGRAAQRTTWRWIDEFFARNEARRRRAPRRRAASPQGRLRRKRPARSRANGSLPCDGHVARPCPRSLLLVVALAAPLPAVAPAAKTPRPTRPTSPPASPPAASTCRA